jgi:uncharacterized protein (TIGR00251 family)
MKLVARVIPRAKKERLEDKEGRLKVYLSVPAIEGKANKRLIEVLAKHYNVRKSAVKILIGKKNRDKVIQISGID